MFAECPINGTRQSWLCRYYLWRVLFAECGTRRTICRVFYVVCRVFRALGKLRESGDALHNWYLKASAEGQMVISALVKDEHYFRGIDEIIIFFEEFWYLYHQDALNMSLVSAWVL